MQRRSRWGGVAEDAVENDFDQLKDLSAGA